MIRVLICDDQALVRDGLRAILEADEEVRVVGEAADGREAVERAQSLAPDVVLMDVRMPRMDGIEATARIVQQPGFVGRVLVLTTFDADEYVYGALKAGASGFLLKDMPKRDLLQAIRTVTAGDALLAPTVTGRLIQDYVSAPPPGGPVEVLELLTEREREVFELVVRGLSNAEIGRRLYLGEPTVKTHVAHAFAKLGLRDRVQAVIFAYETGCIRPGQAPA